MPASCAHYLLLLIDKLVGHVVPVRFVLFAAVGTLGIAAHLIMLRLALPLVGFEQAQTFATAVAIVANYTLNNLFTFRDRRLRGRRLVIGLITFSAICSVGAAANVGAAEFLFGQRHAAWCVRGGGRGAD